MLLVMGTMQATVVDMVVVMELLVVMVVMADREPVQVVVDVEEGLLDSSRIESPQLQLITIMHIRKTSIFSSPRNDHSELNEHYFNLHYIWTTSTLLVASLLKLV